MQGIYMIKNIQNNKIYIGSSSNISMRWERHIYDLLNKLHHSYKLQKEFNKSQLNNFSFIVLEITKGLKAKDLLKLEQEYIDQYESYNDDIGYNVTDSTLLENTKINIEMLKDYICCDIISLENKNLLKQNINILNSEKLNEIGEDKFNLSKTWFNKYPTEIKRLNKNILNYFMNHINSRSEEIYWTSFRNLQKRLSSKGFIKSFLPINAIHIDNKRNNLCFAANCFINSFSEREFKKCNIVINTNKYSVSLLLNWIINVSDINKNINIYIPSKRMRNLLIDWLNN